eukprot:Partr_v1_DN27032_c1_g1_i1_m28582 putative serine threonine-protein kinase
MIGPLTCCLFVALMPSVDAHPQPNGALSGLKKRKPELEESEKLEIYNKLSQAEKEAVLGTRYPTFDLAKEWICTWPENDDDVVIARYKIGPSLGKGSFGHVYRAIDTCDGSEWAMKQFLKISWPGSQPNAGTFQHEMQIMDRIGDHPNIIPLHRKIDLPDVQYALMPVMMGVLSPESIMSPKIHNLRAAMKQLTAALYAVHIKDIMHCDIKLDNILVESTRPLKIRLADFGLAFDLGSKSIDNARAHGTRDYQPLDKAFSVRRSNEIADDIWSLGIVLRELLFGEDILRDHLIMYYEQQSLPKLPDTKLNDFYRLMVIISTGYGKIPDELVDDYDMIFEDIVGEDVTGKYFEFLDNLPGMESFLPPVLLNAGNGFDDLLSFLRDCLRFDEKERATAEELRGHSFINYDDTV